MPCSPAAGSDTSFVRDRNGFSSIHAATVMTVTISSVNHRGRVERSNELVTAMTAAPPAAKITVLTTAAASRDPMVRSIECQRGITTRAPRTGRNAPTYRKMRYPNRTIPSAVTGKISGIRRNHCTTADPTRSHPRFPVR